MQLRSWVMRSSMESLIRSSLNGQKRLLNGGKPSAERGLDRAYRNPRPVTKSGSVLPCELTTGFGHPGRYPVSVRSTPGVSARHVPRVGGGEPRSLGLREVLRRLSFRRVGAAQDDEIAGGQPG